VELVLAFEADLPRNRIDNLLEPQGQTAEEHMAKKTIRISDMSGQEIPEGRGAVVRITFVDARRGARELDVTDAEAEKLGGRQVARRGRKPKVSA
jgi:hypothetical protein